MGGGFVSGHQKIFSSVTLLGVTERVAPPDESILSKNNHVEMRGLIIEGSLRFAQHRTIAAE